MANYLRSWSKVLLLGGIVGAGLLLDVGPGGITLEPREAQAIIGRPLTPMSYAGVARRTVRRTAYAGAAYGAYGGYGYGAARVAALPGGCIAGGGIYTCGAVRYRAVYDGPNVVYMAL